MESKLVKSYRQEIYADSRIIAEKFKKNHQHVLEKIDRLKKDLEKEATDNPTTKNRSNLIFKEKTRPYRGQNFRYVELNRSAFTILVMGFTGKKALKFKLDFEYAFCQMEKKLLQQSNSEWLTEREHGKEIRLNLVDEIKTFVDYATNQGSKSANKYYMNITRMEYKALGFIEKNEKISKELRNTLNLMDLSHLIAAESVARKALITGMEQELHYKDCFQLAKKNVIDLADIMVIKKTKMIDN